MVRDTFDSHPDLVDKIATIIQAAESYQWAAGDEMVGALGRNTDLAEGYIKDDLQPRLEARGLDVEYERLRAYYRIALYNPTDKRFGVSFTAAEEFGQHPDRFKHYKEAHRRGRPLSKREVRRIRGDRKLDTAVGSKHTTVAEKKSALETLLKDEDIVQRMAAEPELRSMVDNAVYRARETERAGVNKTRGYSDPMGAYGPLKVAVDLGARAQHLFDLLADPTPDTFQDGMEAAIEQAINTLTMAKARVRSRGWDIADVTI